MSHTAVELPSLSPVQEAEYVVSVVCLTCNDPDDALSVTVAARSAAEAMYLAASEAAPQTAVAYAPPAGRLKTYEDWCDDWAYAHEYSVQVGCDYASDTVEGIGGEALSAARALTDAAGFDADMREHRGTEW